MRRLAPYPTLAESALMDVTEVRLDDTALPFAMVSPQQRMVALHKLELDEWRTASLSVRVRVASALLDVGPWNEIACTAVHTERVTNVRTATRLAHEAAGIWSGRVVLHRDRHVGRVNLTAQITATVGDVAGRTIGAVEHPWTVDLQAREPVRTAAVRTVWADFGDEDHPHLHAFKSDPWTVEAGSEDPTLYLNRRFEGLEFLLGGSRSIDRPAREALAAQIAHSVWIALFNAAASAAHIEDDRPEWPGGWRESTLRKMLPHIFPDLSPDDALSEVVHRRETGEGGADLQPRLLHAAAEQARLTRALGGFIRTQRKQGQEDR